MYYTDNLFLLTTPCLALHFSESLQFFFFFLTRLHSDTVQLVSYRFSAQTQNCVVFEKQQDNVLKLRVTKDLIMGCCCSQIFKSKDKKRDSSSSSSGSSQERSKKPQSIKAFIDECVKVHNKYRKKHGVSSLSHAKVRSSI